MMKKSIEKEKEKINKTKRDVDKRLEESFLKISSILKKLSLSEVSTLIKLVKELFDIDFSIPVPTVDTVISLTSTPPDVKEQTSFNILLVEVPTDKRIPILKCIRSLTGLGLADSKTLMESVPKVIKENISKEECEKIKKDLETAGAKVSIQ